MSEQLQYDPKSKQLIRDRLYYFLYEPVEQAFQKRLDAIIEQNSRRMGNAQRRLNYKCETYEATNPGPPDRAVNRCHKELLPLMKDYVADLEELNTQEVPYVLGYITKVLNSSESMADYFRLLPESVHEPLKKLECLCQNRSLPDDKVEQLKARHEQPILMMKKRMVENLLL